MNGLQKVLKKAGISQERYDSMTESERDFFVQISDDHSAIEKERDDAISALDKEKEKVSELEGDVETITKERDDANSSLDTANAKIDELNAQIVDLNTKLGKKPAQPGTKVIKPNDDSSASDKKTEKRSWEIGYFD